MDIYCTIKRGVKLKQGKDGLFHNMSWSIWRTFWIRAVPQNVYQDFCCLQATQSLVILLQQPEWTETVFYNFYPIDDIEPDIPVSRSRNVGFFQLSKTQKYKYQSDINSYWFDSWSQRLCGLGYIVYTIPKLWFSKPRNEAKSSIYGEDELR